MKRGLKRLEDRLGEVRERELERRERRRKRGRQEERKIIERWRIG